MPEKDFHIWSVDVETLYPAHNGQRLRAEVDPQRARDRAVDLEQLDVDDDLTLGLVVRVDDLLGDGDLVRRVLDRHGVQRIVLRDLAGVQERSMQKDLPVISAGRTCTPVQVFLIPR